MKGYLVLENGRIFEGKLFGSMEEGLGEVVFNTGMTGYQEILTDPSYHGQIVTLTYPPIGNYGINLEDGESPFPKVRGLIVREYCSYPSNFRSAMDLDQYLKLHKIPALGGIDTRELTKMLREAGTIAGIIVKEEEIQDMDSLMKRIKGFSNRGAVKAVTSKQVSCIEGQNPKYKVAMMDFGVKGNITRSLISRNCQITVFPAFSSAQDILASNPDGIFLSNGPGDPKELTSVIQEIKELMGKKPIFGICLGHQLLWLALGGDTTRLKFGHRGCNHPVKDLNLNRIYLTSQNHGYVASGQNIPDVEITHVSLNDNSIEGIGHKKLPAFSVQFHPEACPGPEDTGYLFDKFIDMMEEYKNAN